jgi:hypothetical protein
LPIVNVSLFQTPGGKIFSMFLHELSKFVVVQIIKRKKKKLKKEKEVNLSVNSAQSESGIKTQIKVFKKITTKNLEIAKQCEQTIATLSQEAKSFILQFSGILREVKSCKKENEENMEQLLEQTRKLLPDVTSTQDLKKICQSLKVDNEKLTAECNSQCTEIIHGLEIIRSVLEPKAESSNVCDVSEIIFDGETFTHLVERLITTSASVLKDHSCVMNKVSNFPFNSMERRKSIFEKHSQSLNLKKVQIINDILPKTLKNIEHLRELRGQEIANTDFLPRELPRLSAELGSMVLTSKRFTFDTSSHKEGDKKVDSFHHCASKSKSKCTSASSLSNIFTMRSSDASNEYSFVNLGKLWHKSYVGQVLLNALTDSLQDTWLMVQDRL